MHINDTFNLLDTGDRIHSACFIDGDDDDFIVQFFAMPGSIARATYNRRTTERRVSFVPVASWEYRQLERMFEGQQCYSI